MPNESNSYWTIASLEPQKPNFTRIKLLLGTILDHLDHFQLTPCARVRAFMESLLNRPMVRNGPTLVCASAL